MDRVFRQQAEGKTLDLEATEFSIRHSMHQVGGVFLEKLINADGGEQQGPRIDCGLGHQAEFLDYRNKQVTTVLAEVLVKRAYYHCSECQAGTFPKDKKLDIVDTTFSPGVRRMMGRVGGKEPFAAGKTDLEELAGVKVTSKEVGRVSEAIGTQIEKISKQERVEVMEGKVVPLLLSIPKFYIAIDGTGVPVVPSESQGRKGKQSEIAKTREAKLGCVFTQTKVDEDGFPVRDEGSSSYVGAIETAEEFGSRIYAEAVRRGLNQAEQVIVLGDGAAWIRGICEEHFLNAIQIVDLYHALDYLWDIGKLMYGSKGEELTRWVKRQKKELKEGDVRQVMATIQELKPSDKSVAEAIEKKLEYFDNNQGRMRYSEWRAQGLFVGSGVIEAGCKTIVGQRLKQSGMRWTVKGANEIIALRCCQISGQWENFWENRAVG